MIGLSSMGSGLGNSSTSNLSASAPPFTVDRLNPNPNSNPLMQYSDSPYAVEPFTHPSQYAPRSEPAVDSAERTSFPISDGYRFSASPSVPPSTTQWSTLNSSYGGDVKSYYNPYNPPLVGEESLLATGVDSRYNLALTSGLTVTSEHDYSRSLFDLEYGPRWVDCSGLDEGKRPKRSDYDGNFSAEKQHVGGSLGYENQPYPGGHGSEKTRNHIEDSALLYKNREVYNGYLEDKSCLEQVFHYDSTITLPTPSTSPYPESYPSLSSAVQKDFLNYQSSHGPYEKLIRPNDTPILGRVSVTKSSQTVVIRPPPATNLNLGQGTTSRKPSAIHIVDSGLKPNSKPKDDYFETSITKCSKQGNANAPISSSSDCKIEAKLRSQAPDANVSSGDSMRVVNSTDESSFVDHHNTAVDSPCWRGAPSSQTSIFDIEAGNTYPVKINLEEHYGFGHGEHQSLLSTADSNRVFSKKDECNMGKEDECGKISSSVFYMKVPDNDHLFRGDVGGMAANDGVAIAVDAAEKVLASPASQEDPIEHIKIRDPGLDVAAIVKTVHNLSELLRFHVSSDVCSLGEENAETLKSVINNLNTCLREKDVNAHRPANNLEQRGHVLETSEMGVIMGGPRTKCEPSNDKGEKDNGKKDEISLMISPLRDDLHIIGDNDMAKAIKKILEQNFEINEEMDSQALLFKSLWLESEAKLCSISYKARFERMKIEMEEVKLKASKAKEDTADITSELCLPPNPITIANELAHGGAFLKPASPNVSTSSIEDSVLARLNILKSCEENINQVNSVEQQRLKMVGGDLADPVMTRLNILKSREENTNKINSEEQQQLNMVGGDHADPIMARFSILKKRENSKLISVDEEKLPHVINDEKAVEPDFQCATGCFNSYFDRSGYENNSRWRDSSSSEWEHVMKEDFSWKN